MVRRPLESDPGTKYAYSNFGYCMLGRVVEKIAGVSYERFVRENVLAPIGIQRMRIGASLADNCADGEVRYYTRRDETAEIEAELRCYRALEYVAAPATLEGGDVLVLREDVLAIGYSERTEKTLTAFFFMTKRSTCRWC